MEETGKNPTAANGNPGFQHFDQLLPPEGCTFRAAVVWVPQHDKSRDNQSYEKNPKSRDENPLGSKQ